MSVSTPGACFVRNMSGGVKGIRYKVFKAKIYHLTGEPGKILDKNFSIACADQSISILEIQKEGKKKLNIKDFLVGAKITVGDSLS